VYESLEKISSTKTVVLAYKSPPPPIFSVEKVNSNTEISSPRLAI
jgi:hypothetical protein